jgi:hypothetical protein
MPDDKKLHKILDELERIKSRIETIQLDLEEIVAAIDAQWEEVSGLLEEPEHA